MPHSASIYFFDSKPKAANQPTVVLVHGAGGTHLHWPYNLRRLNGFRVLAPDLPGHGKSEGIGEHKIESYARQLADWLGRLEIKRANLVGHSMGGAIVQMMALKYPKLVEKLVLVSTGSNLPVNPDLLEKIASPATAPVAMDLIVRWSYSKNADGKLLEKGRKQMDAVRPTVIYGDFLACSRFDIAGKLAKIKAPALILCGEEDKMTPLRFSQQLKAGIPDAMLNTVPGSGHMVMLEQPEWVAEQIKAFLDG